MSKLKKKIQDEEKKKKTKFVDKGTLKVLFIHDLITMVVDLYCIQ